MIDRRKFLSSSLAGVAGSAMGAPGLAATFSRDEGARVRAIFERMYDGWLDRSPEGLTELGLDSGRRAVARSQLDDRSRAADEAFVAMQQGFVGELDRVDGSALDPHLALCRDIVLEHLKPAITGARRYPFGARGDSAPFMLTQFSGVQPYLVDHLNGAYAWLPDFLTNKHPLATAADAQAYVHRIERLGTILDQETDRATVDGAEHGAVPPAFIVAKALQQLERLRDTPSRDSALVARLRARADPAWDKMIDRAIVAMDRRVKPALDRQIALMASFRQRSASEPGVWKLRDGDGYYAHALQTNTSTSLPASEIHRIGRDQVAQIAARANALLIRHGYTSGPVGARLAALASEDRFRFANDAKGRAAILERFRSLTDAMTKQLPTRFGALPDAALRIEPVPAALEASAPRGYYQKGALDGSRPGTYFVNLRDTAEWSGFYLPTFAFHEGVPGHHLQAALAQENSGNPEILRLLAMPGFSEGWALYAEQLADEMGIYADDTFGEIGYLQSLLLRAVRLVADTGIHHERWERERAIRYIVETVGESASRSASEVDRYVVWPGQACSYKLGHTRWVDLRRRARDALGDRFDVRAFHDAALRHGAMSFAVLDRTIERWTTKLKANR